MSDSKDKDSDAITQLMLRNLLQAASDHEPVMDGAGAISFERMAKALVDSVVSSRTFPEAWAALLEGEYHPVDAARFTARDRNGHRRGWPESIERSAQKWFRLNAALKDAQMEFAEASRRLKDARECLQEEEERLVQMRLKLLAKDLAKINAGVFAAGPAWVVLKALTMAPFVMTEEVPEDCRKHNEEIRDKLVAYGNDRDFIENLRAAIIVALAVHEEWHPSAVLAGRKLDLEEMKGWFNEDAKKIFETFTKDAKKKISSPPA